MEKGETSVSARLLDFLRQRLGRSALTYATPPVELQGGFESLVYSFALGSAPPEFEGPLVLRVLRRLEDPERALREAVIHNTVAEHGFPAPRVLIAVTTSEQLGAPFLIMLRVPGTTMLTQFEGLPRRRIAALLESSAHQRDRSSAQEGVVCGEGTFAQDALRLKPSSMRAAPRLVRHSLSSALPQGGRDAEPRLGADGDLLSLSERSLDPPAHHQSGGIAILGGAA